MITSVWEVKECKRACMSVMKELEAEGIPYNKDGTHQVFIGHFDSPLPATLCSLHAVRIPVDIVHNQLGRAQQRLLTGGVVFVFIHTQHHA